MANNKLQLYLRSDVVKESVEKTIPGRSADFISSALSIANNNILLQECDPADVIRVLLKAAAMRLPIDPNLGFAHVIPFWNNKAKKYDVQFILGYKAFVQLALRSGYYKTINVTDVRETEYQGKDRMTGIINFEWVDNESERNKLPIVGYLSYFKLLTGFEQTRYMSVDDLKEHARKYSQTYKKGYGKWVDDFDSMATKGLALDTPIKTIDGWKTMGEIEVGNLVYDDNGREVPVIAVSEVKNLPCYAIEFSNGEKVICDSEHTWNVNTNSYRVKTQLSAKELSVIKKPKETEKKKTITIDATAQAGARKKLLVNPYLLGYWLGDGSSGAAAIKGGKEDIDHLTKIFEASNFSCKATKDTRSNSYQLNISRGDKTVRSGGFREQLFNAGVLNNKHIPEIYENASFDQRLQLVRGLMDSDGNISKRKNGTMRVAFSQSEKNKELVFALYRILCSLGETPCIPRKFRYHGFSTYGIGYNISFTPKNNLFWLPRKASLHVQKVVKNVWSIKSVKKIMSVPTVCIAVDSPSHTFLCGTSQIPTHNTVVKLLLSKWGPLSTEMQQAILSDQAALGEEDNYVYVDNDKSPETTETNTDKAETVDKPKEVKNTVTKPKPVKKPDSKSQESNEEELAAMRESILSAAKLLDIDDTEMARICNEVASKGKLEALDEGELSNVYDYLADIEQMRSETEAVKHITKEDIDSVFGPTESLNPKK